MGLNKQGTVLGLGLCAALVAGAVFAGTITEPKIDKKADRLLRLMSKSLSEGIHFSIEVEDTIDEVLEDGRKIQLSHLRRAIVSRPNRFRVETTGDVVNRTVWYDGARITLLDANLGVFGQIDAPPTIDETIDFIVSEYGVETALADLLSDDPYEHFTKNVISGEYVGLHNVEDQPCHHLLFSQDAIDWQIWLEDTERALPRKLIITFKSQEGEPQYILRVLETRRLWTEPSLSTFTPDIADTVTRIDALPWGKEFRERLAAP